MTKARAALVGGLIISAAVVVLALGGCGGGGLGITPGNLSPGVSTDLSRLLQTHWLGAYPYPVGSTVYYRWRDLIDNQYSSSWPSGGRTNFYKSNQVQVRYDDWQTTHKVSGTLVATGLKPNFVLQTKLEGQPTTTYPGFLSSSDPADLTNTQLGQVGRWWCVNDGWNVTDAELPLHQGHTILGYLVFDFCVTDKTGAATYPFVVNSSYHVVWRTDQRTRAASDGPVRTVKVQGGPPYYNRNLGSKSVGVYAEYEPTRPLPGQLTLPSGNYKCRLLLTEETFHNVPPALGYTWGLTNYADGGFWAHAVTDENLAFTIQ